MKNSHQVLCFCKAKIADSKCSLLSFRHSLLLPSFSLSSARLSFASLSLCKFNPVSIKNKKKRTRTQHAANNNKSTNNNAQKRAWLEYNACSKSAIVRPSAFVNNLIKKTAQ